MAKVLVTGASGFIASHTILALLARGYEVRGTVRDASKGARLNRILGTFSGEAVNIEIVEADLSSDQGWDKAVEGVSFVQHIASPLPANLPHDVQKLIVPAREGALRVLKAAKCAGVKRVVMTSSTAAIAYGWGDRLPDILTEEHWSNPENLNDHTAYTLSKTLAEKAAWDYVKQEGAGLELTTIQPSVVVGPVMSNDYSTSIEIVTQLLQGKLPGLPKLGFQLVDVRDVADAHVRAMETPEAAGERFIVTNEYLWLNEIAQCLKKEFPEKSKRVPTKSLPSWFIRVLAYVNPPLKLILPNLNKKRFHSNEKSKTWLKWQPRPASESLIDCVNSLDRMSSMG